jgi:hypothetical protein
MRNRLVIVRCDEPAVVALPDSSGPRPAPRKKKQVVVACFGSVAGVLTDRAMTMGDLALTLCASQISDRLVVVL